MKEYLEEIVSVRLSKKDLTKIDEIRFTWENQQTGMIISRSDVLRVCMRATYEHLKTNNSLNETLTNSS